MASFSNLWSCTYQNDQIEIELYAAGIMSAGASLFVNSQRVDTVPYFNLLACNFTLRHISNDKLFVVSIVQRPWGSKAFLQINGQNESLIKNW